MRAGLRGTKRSSSSFGSETVLRGTGRSLLNVDRLPRVLERTVMSNAVELIIFRM